MKIKRLSAVLLALMLSMGVFSTTAFAYVDETATEEPPEEEVVTTPEPTVPMNPLTPDGNLTLVDDEGKLTGEGKQFITVVTKTGNFFYIIIDRDDKGEQTVHFLNQVDEADLLKLMDEKEVEKLKPIVEEPAPEPAPVEPVPEPEKKPNVLPAILSLIALAGGGGFFAWKKFKEKKQEKEQLKPDPDADYVDEDDYGYDEEDYSDEENMDEPV